MKYNSLIITQESEKTFSIQYVSDKSSGEVTLSREYEVSTFPEDNIRIRSKNRQEDSYDCHYSHINDGAFDSAKEASIKIGEIVNFKSGGGSSGNNLIVEIGNF